MHFCWGGEQNIPPQYSNKRLEHTQVENRELAVAGGTADLSQHSNDNDRNIKIMHSFQL